MKKILWLPMLATMALISLFFVRNIAIDDGFTDTYCHDEEASVNDLGEEKEERKKESLVDMEDFEDFLLSLGDKPLVHLSEKQLDSTGDGNNETVIEKVYVKDGKCFIQNTILKGNRKIWNNEFALNQSHLKWYFGEDLKESGLQDYALFYLGLTKVGFVEKLARNSLYEQRSREMSRTYLKDTGMDIASMYESDFHRYLRDYNGYFVFDRSPGSNSIYLWSESEQSFIMVWEANNAPTLI